ncbi:MAG: cytochrome c3 family protein [Gammaproteobacteria bacterium]
MKTRLRNSGVLALVAIFLTLAAGPVQAKRIADIRNTKHNFSATVIPILPNGAQRNAAAASESQICAFCHTPHGATKAPKAPLWNRNLSKATYKTYSSGSLDAVDLGQPSAKSKLCLSCHDGTLALGAVNVLNRVENPKVDFTGPGIGPGDTIPRGLGETTGFTRKIGTDLTNDHPISFTFDSAQAARDGELYNPATVTQVHERVRGEKAPLIPLENNKVECISCHDPHIRDTTGENIKFLRVNRFQKHADPVAGQFNKQNDIICLACHNKAGWVGSAHENSKVATYDYTDAAADLREFPRGTKVWQAACLNCHDPHTVQGSRRILREGTDGPIAVTPEGAKYHVGGKAAIEQTCYACHSADGGTLRNQSMRPGFGVPDIKTDFTTLPRHMPISNTDQAAGKEMHDIGTGPYHTQQGGKDFIESQLRMGKGNLNNRHAECTDCHNPHRLIKNRLFNDDPNTPDTEGTHPHTVAQIAKNPPAYPGTPAGIHTNLASGVLRGAFGVEPSGWSSTAFGSEPTFFQVKRGDPGVGGSTAVSAPYVTREYQVCLKCHSNYAFNSPPPLGMSKGTTPPGTNAMFNYTNVAMEYQSPDDQKGEVATAGTEPPSPTGAFKGTDPAGNVVNYLINNHRAWHPVMKPTGRTPAQRGGANVNLWRSPFNVAGGMGNQTMYCTDCHGSDTNVKDGAVPRGGEQGKPWGPHGSSNDFLLKGPWNNQSGTNQPDALCFRCHNYEYYGKSFPPNTPDSATVKSGFRRAGGGAACVGTPNTNLHTGHAMQGVVRNFRCTYCHVSVPHGWKNKNFLANLNDVGPEAGLPPGTQVRTPSPQRYYKGPYYNGSTLKVVNFQRSGEWTPVSCGSAGPPGNGLTGISWMNGFASETCNNIP